MRKIAFILSLSVMLFAFTACNNADPAVKIQSSQGTLVVESSSSQEEGYRPEWPSADSSSPLTSSESSASSVGTSSVSSTGPNSQGEQGNGESQGSGHTQGSSQSDQGNGGQTDSSLPSDGNGGDATPTPAPSAEISAVWFSYIDLQPMLTGRSESQFRSSIAGAFQNVADMGFNTVIVQVRPFGDALYDSDYFPWSYLCTGTEGKNPGYDPLSVMVREARNRGLRIEAWVNPYRVRSSGNSNTLSSDNKAQQWLDAGSDAAVRYGGGIYYNPASSEARNLIVNGVRELVLNYDIDAIHFDDYFYPTTSADFDRNAYQSYCSGGGGMSLGDWRRENVNILVRSVYSAVKSVDSSVLFGISPQGNTQNNYNTQYIDCAKWLSNSGYVDYICPQIYFGFQNSAYPFASTVRLWNDMVKVSGVQLYVGIAPYKLGLSDQWAGAGANEWIGTTDILKRMVVEARSYSKYTGFAAFRYGSMFTPDSSVSAQVKQEMQNLKSILG